MLDPSSAQYASDLMTHVDFSIMTDALHGAAMHLSAAAAATADGVVDISKVSSSVAGTGMTKPAEFAVEWPSGFDPWAFWMASLKATIFKLHDITGKQTTLQPRQSYRFLRNSLPAAPPADSLLLPTPRLSLSSDQLPICLLPCHSPPLYLASPPTPSTCSPLQPHAHVLARPPLDTLTCSHA